MSTKPINYQTSTRCKDVYDELDECADPGDRIGNNIRPLICVVIKSYRERKLMRRRCQSNEGGLLHTVR